MAEVGMAKKLWQVVVDGKEHVIEFRMQTVLGFGTRRGEVVVDGDLVKVSGTPFSSVVPREVRFRIAGKPALLRRRGLIEGYPELFFGGKLIEPIE